jgi:uncharacterized protein (TIGR02453 family)
MGYLTRDLFQFLWDLKRNNNRDWFQRNKDRYETSVRDPILKFIVDVGPRIKKLSPHFIADASPSGGSMMRIHRDIRFSKDKSPYKIAIGVHFWHAKGKDGATPAFYLHLEPDKSSVGAGIWRPGPQAHGNVNGQLLGQLDNGIGAPDNDVHGNVDVWLPSRQQKSGGRSRSFASADSPNGP